MPSNLDMIDARRVILAALTEDVGGTDLEGGDITSSSVIPADLRFKGVMQARHAMVVAGLPVAAEAFRMVVPEARFAAKVSDGQKVAAGTILAEIEGPARGLLTAERTALNLLQLMSGIATMTAQYAERISGTGTPCWTPGRPFPACASFSSTPPPAA